MTTTSWYNLNIVLNLAIFWTVQRLFILRSIWTGSVWVMKRWAQMLSVNITANWPSSHRNVQNAFKNIATEAPQKRIWFSHVLPATRVNIIQLVKLGALDMCPYKGYRHVTFGHEPIPNHKGYYNHVGCIIHTNFIILTNWVLLKCYKTCFVTSSVYIVVCVSKRSSERASQRLFS